MALSVTCDTCGKAVGNPACPVCRHPGAPRAVATGLPDVTPKDRRDPRRQEPNPRGSRATDPCLTTRQVADRLGVSPNFIIGEIRDLRLKATVIERAGKRTIYRIAPQDVDAYELRHRWTGQKESAS